MAKEERSQIRRRRLRRNAHGELVKFLHYGDYPPFAAYRNVPICVELSRRIDGWRKDVERGKLSRDTRDKLKAAATKEAKEEYDRQYPRRPKHWPQVIDLYLEEREEIQATGGLTKQIALDLVDCASLGLKRGKEEREHRKKLLAQAKAFRAHERANRTNPTQRINSGSTGKGPHPRRSADQYDPEKVINNLMEGKLGTSDIVMEAAWSQRLKITRWPDPLQGDPLLGTVADNDRSIVGVDGGGANGNSVHRIPTRSRRDTDWSNADLETLKKTAKRGR